MRKRPWLRRARARTGDSSQGHTAAHTLPFSRRRRFGDGAAAAARPVQGRAGGSSATPGTPRFQAAPCFLAAEARQADARPGREVGRSSRPDSPPVSARGPCPTLGSRGASEERRRTAGYHGGLTGNRPDHAPGELSLNGGGGLPRLEPRRRAEPGQDGDQPPPTARAVSDTEALYRYKFYSETHLCLFLLFFKKNPRYELVWSINYGTARQTDGTNGSESPRSLAVSRPPSVTLPSPAAAAATTATAATTVSRPRATLPRPGPRSMPATKEKKWDCGIHSEARVETHSGGHFRMRLPPRGRMNQGKPRSHGPRWGKRGAQQDRGQVTSHGPHFRDAGTKVWGLNCHHARDTHTQTLCAHTLPHQGRFWGGEGRAPPVPTTGPPPAVRAYGDRRELPGPECELRRPRDPPRTPRLSLCAALPGGRFDPRPRHTDCPVVPMSPQSKPTQTRSPQRSAQFCRGTEAHSCHAGTKGSRDHMCVRCSPQSTSRCPQGDVHARLGDRGGRPRQVLTSCADARTAPAAALWKWASGA